MIHIEDAFVPDDCLLGGEVGTYGIVLESLSENRIGVSANCLGMARGAFEASLEFAKTQIVRGKPIIEYQAIAHKLADMAADIEASKWLVYYGAWRVDQGTIDAATASKVKLVASEMAVRVTEQAIRIHGGAGIMREYSVGRFHRDFAGLCHRRGDFGNPAQHHLRLAEVPVMTFRAVRFSIENDIARLVLNRPDQRNALDLDMRDEIEQAVRQLRDGRNAKALVIAGAGGAFCAGGDLRANMQTG